jgi:hypothetical protein
MQRRLGMLVSVVCSLALYGAAQNSTDQSALDVASKVIHPDAIRAHIRFLSDSLLTGRAPGTPGYDIAAHYVAT